MFQVDRCDLEQRMRLIHKHTSESTVVITDKDHKRNICYVYLNFIFTCVFHAYLSVIFDKNMREINKGIPEERKERLIKMSNDFMHVVSIYQLLEDTYAY